METKFDINDKKPKNTLEMLYGNFGDVNVSSLATLTLANVKLH